MKGFSRGQRGFTLIELVVVIAIVGVLAAVTTPVVTKYLGTAKERAYNAERARIQAAVDGYYGDPDNPGYLGLPQLPLIGRGQTSGNAVTTSTTLIDQGDPFTAQDHDANGTTDPIEPSNPDGGTAGADLASKWVDDGDGVRTIAADSGDKWTTVGAGSEWTDARYYFIDFAALVSGGYTDKVPPSASADHEPEGYAGTSYAGHYIWYVDDKGVVQSLSATLPSATGFQAGVYP